MAQSIPKWAWHEAEEDAVQMAYMEYAVEHWLRGRANPVVTRAQDWEHAHLDDTLERAEALEHYGWFQGPRSTVSH